MQWHVLWCPLVRASARFGMNCGGVSWTLNPIPNPRTGHIRVFWTVVIADKHDRHTGYDMFIYSESTLTLYVVKDYDRLRVLILTQINSYNTTLRLFHRFMLPRSGIIQHTSGSLMVKKQLFIRNDDRTSDTGSSTVGLREGPKLF